MEPVLEETLSRAALDLNLPPQTPDLECREGEDGVTVCGTQVQLTPGVSTMQANVQFTRRILDLGARLITGAENPDGSVLLRFQAGARTELALTLLPAVGTGLDTVVTPAPDLPAVEVKARLALIIEDYGELANESRGFQTLPGTFTAAIRPNLERSERWAEEARRSGMEVILNLPMEPKDYPTRNPGDDAILVDLSGREIRKRVRRSLEKVGPVPGVKTYMGELAVEDRDVMRAVLEELQGRDLFFIDDTRTQFSVTEELANEIGTDFYQTTSIHEVDAGRRGEGTIGIRFDDLVSRCRARGYAVGIIHAKEPTLEVLADRLPGLAREGIVVMALSEVLKAHALQ